MRFLQAAPHWPHDPSVAQFPAQLKYPDCHSSTWQHNFVSRKRPFVVLFGPQSSFMYDEKIRQPPCTQSSRSNRELCQPKGKMCFCGIFGFGGEVADGVMFASVDSMAMLFDRDGEYWARGQASKT